MQGTAIAIRVAAINFSRLLSRMRVAIAPGTLHPTPSSIGIIAKDTGLKQWYQRLGFNAGPIKTFDHLPFEVAFLSYDLIS